MFFETQCSSTFLKVAKSSTFDNTGQGITQPRGLLGELTLKIPTKYYMWKSTGTIYKLLEAMHNASRQKITESVEGYLPVIWQ